MPYPEDFCKISGKSVQRKIIKFDDFRIRDPTLLSGVLGCLDVSEYPRVVFHSLTEQHEAETFHQRDGTLVWDGERHIFQYSQYGPWHP